MKSEIHPEYNTKAKVNCSCGNNFLIGSTQNEINIEICSNCHPFYTGQEKIIDTAGRVEKFKAKMAKAKDSVKSKADKKADKRTKRGKEKEV